MLPLLILLAYAIIIALVIPCFYFNITPLFPDVIQSVIENL